MHESDGGRNETLAAASVPVEPAPPVEFHSEGRLLIVGAGESALAAAGTLGDALSCHVLADRPTAVPPGVRVYHLHRRRLRVEGHLGAFTVMLEGPDEALDLGAAIDPERPVFDLVLDFGEEPAFAREWGPPGYRRPRDEAGLAAALAELPQTIGRLEKPRFFHLDAEICAHGQPGTEGCRRCIEVCPAEAIASVSSRIRVDPNLCQGGGACSTVCPTGAITYRHPQRADTLETLRRMLTTFREAHDDQRPVLVLLDDHAGVDPLPVWPERVLPSEQHEVGSVGMETWLAALALGAAAVRVVRAPSLAPRIERALDEQLGFARAILAGLGHPADALSWMTPGDDPLAGAELSALPPASPVGADSKRGVLFAAIDHLHAHAPAPAEVVPLPSGAPFGLLHVNVDACTTCLACASVCPTRALAGGGVELPQLRFTEGACVQCGLCEVACPEAAITREARLLLPPADRNRQRVLHEDEPFACISCGRPFAPASTVRAITEKLADHPMFAGDGIKTLQCCDECRLRKF